MTGKSDRWYCPAPFKHVFVDAQGVSPCCATPRQAIALHDWSKNKMLIDIQQKILDRSIPSECDNCASAEKNGLRSLRQGHLDDYGKEIFDSLAIDFVDYRYSNLCNFKCRSCDPRYSHQIANEVQGNKILMRFIPAIEQNKFVSMSSQNVDWIMTHLPELKRLMFTGGEPTVIPEIRKIIKKILENQNLQTKILITTNGSFSDEFWYEITHKLIDRLHWTLSVDAVGSAAEIIRHGTVWNTVEDNWSWLSIHAESLDVNTVISNLNIMQLKPLLIMTKKMQTQSIFPVGKHGSKGFRHQMHLASGLHISPLNWPPEIKPMVMDYLRDCLSLDLDRLQKESLYGLIQAVDCYQFNSEQWNRSESYRLELDKIRNENSNWLMQPS